VALRGSSCISSGIIVPTTATVNLGVDSSEIYCGSYLNPVNNDKSTGRVTGEGSMLNFANFRIKLASHFCSIEKNPLKNYLLQFASSNKIVDAMIFLNETAIDPCIFRYIKAESVQFV
jgi:hypothetical protein